MGKAAENRAGAGAAVADHPDLCGRGVESVVADELGVSQGTVSKWRSRFLRARLEGLTDEPRPGRPRTVVDDKGRAGGHQGAGAAGDGRGHTGPPGRWPGQEGSPSPRRPGSG